jgi:hypothetical protein
MLTIITIEMDCEDRRIGLCSSSNSMEKQNRLQVLPEFTSLVQAANARNLPTRRATFCQRGNDLRVSHRLLTPSRCSLGTRLSITACSNYVINSLHHEKANCIPQQYRFLSNSRLVR